MASESPNGQINIKTMRTFRTVGVLIAVISLFLSACLLAGCGSNAGSTRSDASNNASSSKVNFVGTWVCIGFMADDTFISMEEIDKANDTDTTRIIILNKDGAFYMLFDDGVNEPKKSKGTWERTSSGILIQPGDTEGVYHDVNDGLLYLDEHGLVAVFAKGSDDVPDSLK